MFDFIGDVHGCIEELEQLLADLGYRADLNAGVGELKHPQGRKVVFVGDLNDRGPDSASVLALAMGMCKSGNALCVVGNHDDKLVRHLKGRPVKASHGLDGTIAQLESRTQAFRDELRDWLSTLPYQMFLDNGRVLVAHAGLPEKLHGVENGKAKSHALYGDVEGGKTDENGMPIRNDWAKDYKGTRIVIHGHVPLREVRELNNVWDIDTGACFGNKLSALRYPEMSIVQVASKRNYQPFHPFGNSDATTN